MLIRQTTTTRWSWWKRLGGAAAIGAGAIALQELLARWYYRRTPPPERRFAEDERTAWTPMWREATAPFEWLASAPPPDEVPRGDGAPVLLVHGFLTKGVYLTPLRRWLERLGYEARVADIGWNADCFAALTDRLLEDIDVAWRGHTRRVHLVGHSLGGVLARAATVRAPHAIASLAVLGAPVRGLRLHPGLRAGAALVRFGIRWRRGATVPAACATFACSCPTVRAVAAAAPSDIPFVTIATRNDGVADWRYSVDPLQGPATVTASSHFGLVFDATVYRALAAHLASAAGRGLRATG